MKKLSLAVCIALLALGGFACKDKKADANVPVTTAVVAESLQQLEGFWQRNDAAAPDPNTALDCRYVLIQEQAGNLVRFSAAMKTSGQCNFAELRSKVQATGNLSGAQAQQIVDLVSANAMPASASASWDCAAYTITTNARTVGAMDCALQDRAKAVSGADAAAKSITDILGLAN